MKGEERGIWEGQMKRGRRGRTRQEERGEERLEISLPWSFLKVGAYDIYSLKRFMRTHRCARVRTCLLGRVVVVPRDSSSRAVTDDQDVLVNSGLIIVKTTGGLCCAIWAVSARRLRRRRQDGPRKRRIVRPYKRV